jgi:hypothetical protein
MKSISLFFSRLISILLAPFEIYNNLFFLTLVGVNSKSPIRLAAGRQIRNICLVLRNQDSLYYLKLKTSVLFFTWETK